MSSTVSPSHLDHQMMAKCIALSRASGAAGEYPYGAIVIRDEQFVAASINQVKRDRDITRHAEVVAISNAQKILGTVSLNECTIYINAEPCVFCCYAIRESRIRRVVYGLHSPHMGGVSKWNVLGDADLSRTMPEIFAAPPQVVAGYMAAEAEEALRDWNFLGALVMKERGLFETAPRNFEPIGTLRAPSRDGIWNRLMGFCRRNFFDYFGRR